jgi:hypothetical protein
LQDVICIQLSLQDCFAILLAFEKMLAITLVSLMVAAPAAGYN